ncbi:hypothetical protein HDU97_008535 [Phlyctochytrium planicorne]|nr:hypothetical protein HDU97_008535 [Phlyctochytrium planicorne]
MPVSIVTTIASVSVLLILVIAGIPYIVLIRARQKEKTSPQPYASTARADEFLVNRIVESNILTTTIEDKTRDEISKSEETLLPPEADNEKQQYLADHEIRDPTRSASWLQESITTYPSEPSGPIGVDSKSGMESSEEPDLKVPIRTSSRKRIEGDIIAWDINSVSAALTNAGVKAVLLTC